MRARARSLLGALLATGLLAGVLLAPPPIAASAGPDPAAVVAQYPAGYGWPWGADYYPGSGLAAWRHLYGGYGPATVAYALYPAYGVVYPGVGGAYVLAYPWLDASYPLSPALSYSPYYGVIVYPGSGLYTTPNGTSFVVCPSYTLYC